MGGVGQETIIALLDNDDRDGVPTTDAQWASDKREFVLDDREANLDERERLADERERLANEREALADERDRAFQHRSQALDGFDASAARTERVIAGKARAVAGLSRGEARRVALAAVEVARSELARSEHVPPLLAQFAVLARHLHGSPSLEECLADVLAFTHRISEPSDDVSITTFQRNTLRTRAATSDLARALDEMQEQTDEGPAREAVQHVDDAVVSGNLGTDERWPDFGPLADEVGVLSALSVCIYLDREPGELLGTLNQYSTDLDAFGTAEREMAIVLAAHAAVAIDSVRTTEKLDSVTLGLRTRDVIGQAKGILMERGRLTADQAFDALRNASQLLNRRLADIAADVTYTGDIPKPPRPR
jgi:hypothetical protein